MKQDQKGKESPIDLLKSLKSGYSLPPLSVVALRLVEQASDDTCTVSDLVDLIEKDPSLAVRLLKLANSVLLRSYRPVTTLKQAAVKLGLHRLRIMALSLSLRETFPMGKIGPLDYEEFWRTSLYRALLAKSLAQELKESDPEEVFVAALILEVGFLIFFQLLIKGRDENVSIKLDELEEFLTWERERYGINHRQIGEEALRYWNFPKEILECQRHHGDMAMRETASPLAKICELARRFSRILFHPSEDFHSLFRVAQESSVLLDTETINDILMETFDQVQELAENFKVDLNREKDLMEVMEKANHALSQIGEKMATLQDPTPSEFRPSLESLGPQKDIVDQTLQAVAHEIRNPLTAVGGFAKRLAAVLDPTSEEGRYAQAILEEALRLEKTLSQMTRGG